MQCIYAAGISSSFINADLVAANQRRQDRRNCVNSRGMSSETLLLYVDMFQMSQSQRMVDFARVL